MGKFRVDTSLKVQQRFFLAVYIKSIWRFSGSYALLKLLVPRFIIVKPKRTPESEVLRHSRHLSVDLKRYLSYLSGYFLSSCNTYTTEIGLA